MKNKRKIIIDKLFKKCSNSIWANSNFNRTKINKSILTKLRFAYFSLNFDFNVNLYSDQRPILFDFASVYRISNHFYEYNKICNDYLFNVPIVFEHLAIDKFPIKLVA